MTQALKVMRVGAGWRLTRPARCNSLLGFGGRNKRRRRAKGIRSSEGCMAPRTVARVRPPSAPLELRVCDLRICSTWPGEESASPRGDQRRASEGTVALRAVLGSVGGTSVGLVVLRLT